MPDERVKNVLGQDVEFFVYHPSNGAQNYVLNTKYLTKDCAECRDCIPKEESIAVVHRAAEGTPHKWNKPSDESVVGICIWGKYPKVLVERPKGGRHCDFFGKKYGAEREQLLPED